MPLAVSLLKWRNDKNLSWDYYGLQFAQVMASQLWAERNRSEKDFIIQPKKRGGRGGKKKKETTLQAPTVFGIFIFHFGITHRFFKAGGFPYAVIVLLCFSGLVLSEKTCNPKSRVRGPDWISDAACWIWEEGGRMWY